MRTATQKCPQLKFQPESPLQPRPVSHWARSSSACRRRYPKGLQQQSARIFALYPITKSEKTGTDRRHAGGFEVNSLAVVIRPDHRTWKKPTFSFNEAFSPRVEQGRCLHQPCFFFFLFFRNGTGRSSFFLMDCRYSKTGSADSCPTCA